MESICEDRFEGSVSHRVQLVRDNRIPLDTKQVMPITRKRRALKQ